MTELNILLIALLFAVGLWGTLARKNIIKKVIALSVLNSSIVALFIVCASVSGEKAPIIDNSSGGVFVDPIPQALMLTAIVVGFSLTAVALVFVWRLFKAYGTLNIDHIELRTKDDNNA
ncbi:sodium:proton antiporter [Sediminispirochaeta smaragdinae]|uniref:NADH-ubiquinone oxidoreductase chain 4L n=1 Tax=Sediminispirochaeta smaragdinae (strain DSM 11293 / JCM 15392 / SEBR 4228) TaxID=573413 RepID=E1R813_SEDSS|nr:cation:proton antiporter subunit C [Sediminispirochaeta smaragdinae]ADK82868.1 NADH-ubiquinone oxidoreductase chain 4L [Sediminispirochaeta smaragdinae DSM 11293]